MFLVSWMTIVPYAARPCDSWWSVFAAMKTRKHEAQVRGLFICFSLDPMTRGWATGALALIGQAHTLKKNYVICQKSCKSMNLIFSTTLPGVGDSAGDMICEASLVAGVLRCAMGVARSDNNDRETCSCGWWRRPWQS